MACQSSLLSGLLEIVSGAMIANGTEATDVFGDKSVLSSDVGVPIEVTDAVTGETLAPTLNTVTDSIKSINNLDFKSALDTTILAMDNDPSFTSSMSSAWNNIGSSLSDNAFFDAIGGFFNDVNQTLSSITTSINNSIGDATQWISNTLGGDGTLVSDQITGDPAKFGTYLSSADGYVKSANGLVRAGVNSGVLGDTFQSTDSLVSAGLSGVNFDYIGMGQELGILGNTINLENIQATGSPGQMLKNLQESGGLSLMFDKVANLVLPPQVANALEGVDFLNIDEPIRLGDLPVDLNSLVQEGSALNTALQAQIYQAFTELAPEEVAQVKNILGNTQDAIVTGQDLFDPKKYFPDTFESLTAPVMTASVGFKTIYTDSSGSVSDWFSDLGEDLKGILPDDLASANGALALSLGQVKGIQSSSTSSLGTALQSLESLKNLPLLQALTSPMPTDVVEYYTETLNTDTTTNIALGTGENGELKLSDVIGLVAGYNSAAPLKQNASLFAQVETNGDLLPFTQTKGVYDTIQEFTAGTFGPVGTTVTITAGYVGAGTYTGATASEAYENAFINGIIPATKTICEGYSSNTNVQTIIRNSRRWNEQLFREYINQSRIDNQDFAARSSRDATITFAESIPILGLDTSEGGSAELLERVINYNTLGGQALVGLMREARNVERLQQANIVVDTGLSTDGTVTEGTLLNSAYTEEEAKNNANQS